MGNTAKNPSPPPIPLKQGNVRVQQITGQAALSSPRVSGAPKPASQDIFQKIPDGIAETPRLDLSEQAIVKKSAPKPTMITKQLQGLKGLLAFAINVLVSIRYESWKQTVTRLLYFAELSAQERTKIEYATTCVDPSIIYRELYNFIIDEVAEFIINLSKKYKLARASTPLALKIMELIKKHGGFNLQATKEFYATAQTVCPDLFKNEEGKTTLNQGVSLIVEAVDRKMTEARQGLAAGSKPDQNTIDKTLKLCKTLIERKQQATMTFKPTKQTGKKQDTKPMAIC